MATTLMTAVEVRAPDIGPITIWEMPVRLEKRQDLSALVFFTSSELTSVTILMTEADRLELIKLLGGRKK